MSSELALASILLGVPFAFIYIAMNLKNTRWASSMYYHPLEIFFFWVALAFMMIALNYGKLITLDCCYSTEFQNMFDTAYMAFVWFFRFIMAYLFIDILVTVFKFWIDSGKIKKEKKYFGG